MSANLLETKQLSMTFGGLKAVDQVNLEIPSGVLYGLIGPNGAGKTTFFNLLTGVYQPTAGEIYFQGQNVTGQDSVQRSRLGIARTFQNIRLFKELTVLENVQIASHKKSNAGLLEIILQTKKFQQEEKHILESSMANLEMLNLQDKANLESQGLSYGEQRKLEIARALATTPHLLLLDEPAAGMNASETHQLMDTIQEIQEKTKVTILLIEHDMKLVMGLCKKIYVVDHGQKIAEGTAKEIQSSKAVIEAYLGTEEVHG
jgi:branched-chain amino acid transport system ATP-binding protein